MVSHYKPRSNARLFGWLTLLFCLVLGAGCGSAEAAAIVTGETRSTAAAEHSVARKHPTPMIAASAYVMRDRVAMRLKFFVEDLLWFHEELVQPDEMDRVYGDALVPALQDHRQFLLDKILILDAEGQPTKSKIVDVTPLEVPEAGWAVDELMEHTIEVDMEFTLTQAPEFLTFVQNIVDANFVFPSELELLVRQEGHETIEAKIMRPGDPFTIRLVWDRPQLDAAATQAEFEQLLQQDRDELLGITSYDQLYSFLYITRLEARHEILIPLSTLSTFVSIQHANPNMLDVSEQEAARRAIGEYFKVGNPILIDGLPVTPIVDRIDFYGLSLRDFAQRAEAKPVSMASGRVGVILRYPSKQEPREVQLTWDQFNSSIRKVTTIVITRAQVMKAEFSRFQTENVYQWVNPNPNLEPRGVRPLIEARPEPQAWSILGTLVLGSCGVVGAILWFTGASQLSAWAFWAAMPLALVASGSGIEFGIGPAGKVGLKDRDALVRGLLGNVYRAFDYTEEEEIYDALAQSSSGDLLTTLFLEIKSGLVIQEQGGATAEVERVEVVELVPDVSADQTLGMANPEAPGFIAKCRWNVGGTIEHWGHVHHRVNQYEAIFSVQRLDDAWKLSDMKLTDTAAIENRRSVRRF